MKSLHKLSFLVLNLEMFKIKLCHILHRVNMGSLIKLALRNWNIVAKLNFLVLNLEMFKIKLCHIVHIVNMGSVIKLSLKIEILLYKLSFLSFKHGIV